MKKFLDLGLQPLANSYIKKKDLKSKEKKFRLIVGFDPKNFLVSILNTVPKEKMFNKDYPYKSSESKTMLDSFKTMSKKLKLKFKPRFVIEIGSNDGAFIKNFNRKIVVGVEPCKNLASITKKKKIYYLFRLLELKTSEKDYQKQESRSNLFSEYIKSY